MANWEQFQEKYNSASEEIRAFIDSESIPDFAAQAKEDFALTAAIGVIITHISDAALALQTPTDAVKKIIATDQLPPERQIELVEKLTAFLQEHIPDFSVPETPVAKQEVAPVSVQPQQPAPEPESETSTVPRYARPLTDIPRYGDSNNQ